MLGGRQIFFLIALQKVYYKIIVHMNMKAIKEYTAKNGKKNHRGDQGVK